jgi:uncharacterized OsmC-like protein
MDLDRSVRVRTGRAPYLTDVVARGHQVVVDEPPSVGGRDLGPTPFDLLAAALGSCTTITLRMYADRKQWPVEEILARVVHRRERTPTVPAGVDIFSVELQFRGNLDDEQRTRLVEIAGRCPVHRTLAAGATIETREV